MGLKEYLQNQNELLAKHLAEIGFEISAEANTDFINRCSGPLAVYLELLERWTKRVDLVSPAPAELLADRHIIDAVAALRVLRTFFETDPECALFDLGSGAGLPGLVWAVLEPQRAVVLCEPRQRRVDFLKEAKRQLGLENIIIVCKRAEHLSVADLPPIALVSTRALGDYESFLSFSAGALRPSGRAVLLAGPNWQCSEKFSKFDEHLAFEQLIPYSLAKDGPQRQLAVWKCFT